MEYFLQQFINGLTLGSIYGLIAIGYTMVFGIIGLINFAHGEVYMIGAFISMIAIVFLQSLGIGSLALVLALALLGTTFFTAVYGWTIEHLAYRRLLGSFRLAPLISAIGVSIFLQNYVRLLQGARVKTLPPLITDNWAIYHGDNFTVSVSAVQIGIVLVTLFVMLGLTYLIGKTSLGRAQRACAQDQIMASLLGVNVSRTISTTFILGAVLAAVAGMMVTLYYGVIDFYIGFLAGMKAFTAAVLGGIGSLPGAMLGGLMIGLIEAFWSGYVNVGYKDVATFVILILILIFKPTGLFGQAEVQKV